MQRSRIMILGILVLILAIVVCLRIVPRLGAIGPRLNPPESATANASAGQAHLAALSSQLRLKDGSFNPIAPKKSLPADDPAQLVAGQTWRERYRPFLEKTRAPETSPGFYVYPFLDRTKEGVGLNCTYGWHLVGTAALATWTQARLTGAQPPKHYGLPEVDESASTHTEQVSFAQWQQRALRDPAAGAARYLVAGAYDFDSKTKQYSLTLKLLDREKAGEAGASVLFEAEAPVRGDFAQLAALQRTAARAMADKLIQLGLTQAKPSLKPVELKLETEMSEVARLLDANDSWAVMDGIDRALQLAALFPGDTLPLQAAAYGMNELNWMLGYDYGECYDMDYSLRAYALAQIALAIDSKPAMSQLNFTSAAACCGIEVQKTLTAFMGNGHDIPRELALYRVFILGAISSETLSENLITSYPDWQVLWLETKRTWYYGQSGGLRDYFNQRLPFHPNHDLFFMAMIRDAHNERYNSGKTDYFKLRPLGSALLTRLNAATEMATLLGVLRGNPATDSLIREASFFSGLEEKKIRALSEAGDYFALRNLLLDAFKGMPPPAESTHPYYRLLGEMNDGAEAVAKEGRLSVSSSGFPGFEFTPAERVTLARRQDYQGPIMMAQHEGQVHGVYEEMLKISRAYLQLRPDNAEAQSYFASMVRDYQKEVGSVLIDRAAYQEACHQFPLKSSTMLSLAGSYFTTGQPGTGLPILKEYFRMEPFDISRYEYMGNLCSNHGYRAQAAQYYGEFLKHFPARYDIANSRAFLLCQMGHEKDPEVRATFAKPAPLLPGNSSFHQDNLKYLLNWACDYPAARQAAAFYRKWKKDNSAILWQAWIERADGKTTKALEFLAQADPGDAQNLILAAYHTSLANVYLDLDRTDLALPHIREAVEIDDWKCDVIEVMARLAFVKGKYDEAIKQYQRALDRYGFNADIYERLADCYERQGDRQAAIRQIENGVFEGPDRKEAARLVPRLMQLYAKAKQSSKARDAMEFFIHSGACWRTPFRKALDDYKTIEPRQAQEIEKNFESIMAGPPLDWP